MTPLGRAVRSQQPNIDHLLAELVYEAVLTASADTSYGEDPLTFDGSAGEAGAGFGSFEVNLLFYPYGGAEGKVLMRGIFVLPPSMKTKAITGWLFRRFEGEGVPPEGQADQLTRSIGMIDGGYCNRRLQKPTVAVGCSVAIDRCTLLKAFMFHGFHPIST
ncbi:Uncharacterized protein TCM_002699 [Theobroma cacao]|uniref:Uncharacterized protein n=1 Tax=Theobroma cacao TaxID=3641 RepID=A0A061DUW3_THECC|nr:Uncharacterized protein TCM_002699 [Theobroma cacao]